MRASAWRSHRHHSICCRSIGYLLSVALATPLAAQVAPSYEFKVGVGQSDNIQRTPSAEQSETIGTAGLDLAWRAERPRLQSNVASDLSYVDYLDNTYDSEVVGNFAGNLRAILVPQRLHWVLSDNFGQGRINPLLSVTPENRENINYLTTGPDLNFGLGSMTSLNVSGRYSRVTYEVNPFDTERIAGTVGILRQLSTASGVSLNLRREQIKFEDDLANSDYDRDEAFVHYEAEGARTQLAADAGYSKLKRAQGDTDGTVARLQVSRQISASSILALSLGREFSDAGDTFRLMQTLGGGGLETQPVAQTANPFTNEYVTLAWNFQRRRTGLDLGLSRFDESYEDLTALDRSRLQGNARVSRFLTPTVEASLLGAYARENFRNLVGDSRERTISALLNWRVGEHLAVGLQFDNVRRRGELQISNFSENRGWLTLGFGRQATARTGPVAPPLPSESPF